MSDTTTSPDPVAMLLSKIATFVASLDEDERALLEQGPPEDDSEVAAFDGRIPSPTNFWNTLNNVLKANNETVKNTTQNVR